MPCAAGQEAKDTQLTWINPYYAIRELGGDEKGLDLHVITGPPKPPAGYEIVEVELPSPDIAAGINVLTEVPAFTWCFGCSATAAAMIAGYYDRTGYPNIYTGPANGGVMALDNSFWGTWQDSCGAGRAQCPLSATRSGLDGRIARGNVDDYWICYGDPGPDPFIANGWTEHKADACTADYMKTSQSQWGSSDGGTGFIIPSDGSRYDGTNPVDGGYGFELFYESRGYTVTERYTQGIYGWDGNTDGFTYDQYKAEIDAGRPVLITVTGHSMVGVGYDDTTSNLMYIHDTWNYDTHTMEWGGEYAGMSHFAVTVLSLESSTPGPEMDVQRPVDTPIPDEGVDDLGEHTPSLLLTVEYRIENHGDGDLAVTGASASNLVNCSGFAVNTSLPTTVPPGGAAILSVSVTPSAAGFTFDLAIENDDPNENPYDIYAMGGSPATIDVSPTTLSATLLPGATDSPTIQIANLGDFDLDWTIGLDPDGWKDSDDPGGPIFSWIDISGSGTPLGLSDDDSSDELALAFPFEFQGQTKTAVYVNSNGFLSFGSGSWSYGNDPIPDAQAPNDIICPFWDDLNPGSGGEVYYHSTASRFVASWVDVPRWLEDSGNGNTFQVILYPDSSIVYQYQSMNADTLQSATVGVENADGSAGTQVAYNEAYVKDTFAVEFSSPWVSVAPAMGTTTGRGSSTATFSLDATGVADGTMLTCDAVISSNDPATPEVIVDLTVNVSDPAPDTSATFRASSEGDVFADGVIVAEGFVTRAADVAEWVKISEPVEPGDVLELDPAIPGHYRKARGQSTRVAGVVSTTPGVTLGGRTSGEMALLALAGFVPTKACDESGPIELGSLLVAAERPGFVRRWMPEDGSEGIVGKAMENLMVGERTILILLAR